MATTTTMNISLPDTMKTFVEERLVSDGYGTASEYVRELIREDQKKREEEKLEKLLLSRLESESEFTIEDVRAELARRVNKRKKR
jgi:antitoxin ParD1/3/4